MKKLIARRPILYHGRDYRQGEALPAGDEAMTAAWLRAGSAAWAGDEGCEDTPPPAPAREKKGRKK